MKNSVHLIGNVGSDPIMRTTDNGKKVCNLSLATTAKWKNEKNEVQEKTEWHHLVIWGKQAEVAAEFIRKGHKLAVDGRIEYRSFKNNQDQEQKATDIVVSEFYFLTPKKAEN